MVSYDEYESFDGKFGHLFYREKLSHYKLRLEYRFVGEQIPGAPEWAYKNSGVKFHSQEPELIPVDQRTTCLPLRHSCLAAMAYRRQAYSKCLHCRDSH